MLDMVNALRLGAMQQLADQCADAPHSVEVFTRLSKKSDKSKETRQAAASNAAYWQTIQDSCAAARTLPSVPMVQIVQPAVHTGGNDPLVNQPVPTFPQPNVNVPLIMPQNYGPPSPAAGPFIAQSVPADVAAAITQANPPNLSPQNSALPSGAAVDECGATNLTYDPDGYGAVQVLQVVCA